MDLEAKLLDALRRDPEDDELRAVYADWLEERSDPRAEYLRLEIAAHGRGTVRVPPIDATELARRIPAAWIESIARRFDLVLVGFPLPIAAVRVARLLTGVGLREAVDIIGAVQAGTPQVLARGVDRAHADAAIAKHPEVMLARRPRHPFSP